MSRHRCYETELSPRRGSNVVRVLKAKYAGRCSKCGHEFSRGTWIVWRPDGRDTEHYVARSCRATRGATP